MAPATLEITVRARPWLFRLARVALRVHPVLGKDLALRCAQWLVDRAVVYRAGGRWRSLECLIRAGPPEPTSELQEL